MTSFGWKRKAGKCVLKDVSKAFETNSKGDEDEAVQCGDVDWLTLAPKRKCFQLEDTIAKTNRLRLEGITLAESERYWEAIGKWDEALHLTPTDEKLFEMKAQALLALGEVYPAVCAAQKAVGLNVRWWVSYQTLGRAQLGMGEVKSALKSFSCAVHLNPADSELRQDDLMWAAELVSRKLAVEREQIAAAAKVDCAKIIELDVAGDDLDSGCKLIPGHCHEQCMNDSLALTADVILPELHRLPANYVVMRD